MKLTNRFILLGLSLTFLSSTTFAQWKGINGQGPVVKKELKLKSFDSFSLGISANVYLHQGKQKVVVEGQQNIIDNLETNVKNGSWKINFDQNVKNHKELNIHITMPSFKSIALSGSGDIVGEDKFNKLKDINIAISGSGDISLDFDAENVNIGISGSGNINLSGRANNQKIGISGSGDVSAFGLTTGNCTISISGSGDCQVHVDDQLQVAIAGSGDVEYKGKPNNVKSNIAGSGDVSRHN